MSNYRIMQARSGSYYAQRYTPYNGWKMIGPFCRTRQGARNVVSGARGCCVPCCSRVVEYC